MSKHNRDKLLRRNIKLLYYFRAIRLFLVFIPILVPFYFELGLSQFDVYVLQSIYACFIVFLEVPSGYFADSIGLKKSLCLGAVLLTTGLLFYSLATDFYSLLIGEVILAFGYSLISGADSALAFESLKELEEVYEYTKFESRSHAIMGFSEAIASITGGMLAIISLRTPVIAECVVTGILIPLSFFLVEPSKIPKQQVGSKISDLCKIVKFAIYDHLHVKWLILYSAILATITHCMVWLTQPYYALLAVPIPYFGLIWAIQLFMMGVFSWYADSYLGILGRKKALISFPLIGIIAYFMLGSFVSFYALFFILCFYFIRGVHTPIFKNLINQEVPSDIRATVLSIQNMVAKLLYAILGPLVGYVADYYSLQIALIFSGVIFSVLSSMVIFRMLSLKLL